MREKLTVVEVIPFESFKEKIKITKVELKKRAKVEVCQGFIYVERREIGC